MKEVLGQWLVCEDKVVNTRGKVLMSITDQSHVYTQGSWCFSRTHHTLLLTIKAVSTHLEAKHLPKRALPGTSERFMSNLIL